MKYRGYIVFFITMFVCLCLCVNFFLRNYCTQGFQISANIGYDFLYCVRENQHPHAYHPFICSFFFFSNNFFSSNFVYTYRGLKYIVKKKKTTKKPHNAQIFLVFFLPFFHLSLQCNAKENVCQRFLNSYCN